MHRLIEIHISNYFYWAENYIKSEYFIKNLSRVSLNFSSQGAPSPPVHVGRSLPCSLVQCGVSPVFSLVACLGEEEGCYRSRVRLNSGLQTSNPNKCSVFRIVRNVSLGSFLVHPCINYFMSGQHKVGYNVLLLQYIDYLV